MNIKTTAFNQIIKIQEGAIITGNKKAAIEKKTEAKYCRYCKRNNEQVVATIPHIINVCWVNRKRHNKIHDTICLDIFNELNKKYNLTPLTYTLENKPKYIADKKMKIKLTFNIEFFNDNYKAKMARRPDVVLINEKDKEILIIDVTIVTDSNVYTAYIEKMNKYSELSVQFKRVYKLFKVTIIPVVISNGGLIHIDSTLKMKKYVSIDWTKSIKYVMIESMKSIMNYLCNFNETIENEMEIEMN